MQRETGETRSTGRGSLLRGVIGLKTAASVTRPEESVFQKW